MPTTTIDNDTHLILSAAGAIHPVDGMRPWDILPDEPNMWYDRFANHYLPLGPTRSIAGAYHAYRVANGETLERAKRSEAANPSWYTQSSTWYWKERAIAYDSQRRAEWEASLDEVIADAQRRVIEANLLLLEKARGGIEAKDNWSSETGNSLANAMAKASIQIREEQRTATKGRDFTITVHNLPENVRIALAAAIEPDK